MANSENVVISGGTGMIGTRLSEYLRMKGYEVYILTRNPEAYDRPKDHLVHWDLDEHVMELPEGLCVDHVVNLAGAGIADKKWTPARKTAILQSRIKATRFLIKSLKDQSCELKTFVSASAVGYYGDAGDRWLTEETQTVAQDFLSTICKHWEQEAQAAADISNRVNIIRIGTVMSRTGGALEKLDKTIPYGLASYLGSGEQYMSWIHIDDLCRIIMFMIEGAHGDTLETYNAVAPKPVTNKALTRTLKEKINSKALLLPVPEFALKLIFGEMSQVLLNSNRVSSQKIQEAGFEFKYPTPEDAISQLYD